MAAGATSGGSLESTLDKKFQNVTNTMESIQGLSTWCIDNKKYHSLIVRHWLKHLKKSNPPHRLNLLYLANDVIQNCKRKNALVYRTAFAEVLPDAFPLINSDGDAKVIKSVERILTIWEERGVYSGTLIANLKNSLVKEESPPETPVEQKTLVESKAELRARIVAEFVPQGFIDQLSKYKRSLNEVDLREKQLAAMRVDICSSEALRKLKDKAGGKKFSRDFEEGSAQLQEFVKFFEQQNKTAAPLLEALNNADIFYEMQYKEVKIVANAYQTFAQRVSHLKRKLDSLKATLPSLDESPIPSPSADAPSPTGSESPFHSLTLANPDPDLDGSALDEDAEPPAPSPLSSPGGSPKHTIAETSDNREVEDMELSDEETDSAGIIVEEQTACPAQTEVSAPPPESTESSAVPEMTVPQVAPLEAAPEGPVEGVDLGKIGSILNSLSSVIKKTGPVSEPTKSKSAVSPVDSTCLSVLQDSSSLSKLLSKVDMSASDLLSALTKVQAQGGLEGISSLLNSPSNPLSDSSASGKEPPSHSSTSSVPTETAMSSAPELSESLSAKLYQSPPPQAPSSGQKEKEPLKSFDSLESKIHNFLQGNPAFGAFDLGFSAKPASNLSPVPGVDAQEGTPVRDEGGSTPTQDEIMDKPVVVAFNASTNQPSVGETLNTAPVAYHNNPQQAQSQSAVVPNGQGYQPYTYSEHGTAPVSYFQQVLAQPGGDITQGIATNTVEGLSKRDWFGGVYAEGSSQQSTGFSIPSGAVENKQLGQYSYQTEQEPSGGAPVSSTVFGSTLPPLPKLPPPPNFYDPSSLASVSPAVVPEQGVPNKEPPSGVSSFISGMIVHDHQHKSVFHTDEPLYDTIHSEYLHPDERRHHGDEMYHHDYYQEDLYPPPGDSYYGPRVTERHTPPLSPSEDEYYDYQHGAGHLGPRRPPPPNHRNFHHRGMRPPHRPPPHPAHHPPHPRGALHPPFAGLRGPDPRLRGKRPGPRRGGSPMFPPKRPYPPPRY